MPTFRKLLTLFLSLVLLLSLVPTALADDAESDPINVLACSDFQAPNGNNEGRLQVSAILNAGRVSEGLEWIRVISIASVRCAT